MAQQPNKRIGIRAAKIIVVSAILACGILMLNGFPNYFPPRFDQGFLRQKEDYFYRSAYFVGFFSHIVSAPVVLFCGVVQMSQTVRIQVPRFHRKVGLIYVVLILVAMAPGGLIMSMNALGGRSSTICFALISIGTWGVTLHAFQLARRKAFRGHQRWMVRSFILVNSAVLLRIFDYFIFAIVDRPVLSYQIAAWSSWVLPMLFCELWMFRSKANSPVA